MYDSSIRSEITSRLGEVNLLVDGIVIKGSRMAL